MKKVFAKTKNVKNFISCQAIKKAIYESLDDLGDIDKHLNVRDRIEKALLVGSNIDDLGMNAYSNDEIIKRVSARQKDEEIIRYKVGWEEFDSIFGGFGAGELFTFGGPAHSGKSMYLVNIGAGLLLNKKNSENTGENCSFGSSKTSMKEFLNKSNNSVKINKQTTSFKGLQDLFKFKDMSMFIFVTFSVCNYLTSILHVNQILNINILASY